MWYLETFEFKSVDSTPIETFKIIQYQKIKIKGRKTQISNTYIPCRFTEFRLTIWEEENKTKTNEKEEQKITTQQDLLNPSISNGWKKNR